MYYYDCTELRALFLSISYFNLQIDKGEFYSLLGDVYRLVHVIVTKTVIHCIWHSNIGSIVL